jgi:CRISPR/Cas system-associated exonuclease Cas4 (RecB family)
MREQEAQQGQERERQIRVGEHAMIAALDTPQSAKVDTESLLAKISASRLTCFLQCRLKFMFRYVLQIKKPATGALHVGKTVHWALQQWSKARWYGEPLDAGSLKQGFDLHWESSQEKDPVAWEIDEEQKQKDKAWGLVDMYLRDTPVPTHEKPEGVEVSIEAGLPDGLPRLVGVIDLVRPEAVIVDFKTSASTPLIAQAIHRNETQLTAYGILHREATGRDAAGFELHHLIKTAKPKLVVTHVGAMTDQREQKFLRQVESYVDGVEREDFVPSPGLHCSSCEYFSHCQLWPEVKQ